MVEQVQQGIEQDCFPTERKQALGQVAQQLHRGSLRPTGDLGCLGLAPVSGVSTGQKVFGRELLQHKTLGHSIITWKSQATTSEPLARRPGDVTSASAPCPDFI